jgi:hypothetical protein
MPILDGDPGQDLVRRRFAVVAAFVNEQKPCHPNIVSEFEWFCQFVLESNAPRRTNRDQSAAGPSCTRTRCMPAPAGDEYGVHVRQGMAVDGSGNVAILCARNIASHGRNPHG